MKTINERKVNLREVDRLKYPELTGYSKAEIWRDCGPGGLYLVSLLAKNLELQPNALVLDLGCGQADSSNFLAEIYHAKVIAVDLWTDPAQNARKIENCGHKGNILPLQLDAAKPLPFAEAYFDAILVVNNLNFYGTDIQVIDRIARRLKPGGMFCSGGECLSEEFTPQQIANPPYEYSFAEEVWRDDFLTSHSPGWWTEHIAGSKELQFISCEEVEDGRRFFEEQALLTEPEGYFGMSPQEARQLEIRQIEYGRENQPYMTVYQLVSRRK